MGSEGTLGIVTELTVRILPLPEAIMTMLAVYNDIGEAARSVSDIITSGIVPATLEMMEHPSSRRLRTVMPAGIRGTLRRY